MSAPPPIGRRWRHRIGPALLALALLVAACGDDDGAEVRDLSETESSESGSASEPGAESGSSSEPGAETESGSSSEPEAETESGSSADAEGSDDGTEDG